MKLIVLIISFTLFFKKKLGQNFKSQNLVPDIFDEEPLAKLDVKFGDHIVSEGNELTPTQVKSEPTIKWNANHDKYYTLLMIDADAPSRKNRTMAPVNHWLVINIPGNNLKSPNAEVITEFLSSGAPKGSGLHRYTFVVYEQKGKITADEPKTGNNSIKHRLRFNIKAFSDKYNLGNPIAGNFFMAQWDNYVDELFKHIKFD